MIDEGSDVLDDEADTAVVPTGLAEPARALHCDPHDFAGLYIRHRAAFTLHARRHLRDARDADDVVQEAFLRLFLALPELDTELQALAYCRRTITNLCIDRYRAQARRPNVVDIGSIPLEELPDEDHGDPVVRAEDAALVREALSMLSPMHRAALVKREIEEKSLPVIAEELQVPEESVKHLLFRARRALRRLLVGTSLDPGADGRDGLALLTRAGSAGVACFLLLVLGLGSGPNLQAIPVVGVDLPEIIPVTDLAKTVGHAVTDAVDAVAPSDSGTGGEAGGSSDPAPQVAADPSSSPATAPPTTTTTTTTTTVAPPPQPAPAPAPPAPVASAPVSPAPAPEAPAPGKPQGSPSPSTSGSPSASPSGSPSPTPASTGEPQPSTGPRPSEPAPSASPTASASRPASAPPSPEASSAVPLRAEVPKSGRQLEVSSTP